MPEGLLLEELENAAPVAESLEKIEEQISDMLRGVAGKLGRVAERMNGTALRFENAWRQVITNVAKGQTAEMQAARSSERQGRVIDRDGAASMELKKQEGYF